MTKQSLPFKVSEQALNDRMGNPDLVFHGYCTDYRYGCFNGWEYSEAIFSNTWDKNNNPLNSRMVGSCYGHASNSFWKVRVVSGCAYTRPEDYARTHVWVEPVNKSNRAIPIELHHSDVLPSVLKDDVLTIQVSLLPKKATYIKTEDPEYLPFCSPDPICVLNEEEPFNADAHRVVHLLGGIRHVDRIPATDDQGPKVIVWIETRFGPLCVIHNEDFVEAKQRKLIRIGNNVVVSGYLMADCAVDAYQEGARYNHANLLTLLKNSLATGRLFRLFRAMTHDCEMTVKEVLLEWEDDNEDHRQRILDLLADWFSHGTLSMAGLIPAHANPHKDTFGIGFVHRTPNDKADAFLYLTVQDQRITGVHVTKKPDIVKRVELTSEKTNSTVN